MERRKVKDVSVFVVSIRAPLVQAGCSGVLGEVPLTDMGIVALELSKEFVRSGEASIWFTDARNSINNKFAKSVISDKVEKSSRELVEDGSSVVFDQVSTGFTCEHENEVRGETNAPVTCH